MLKNTKAILLNSLFWGFMLWLFGYVLGIVFFAFVPKNLIGWYVTPFGVVAILWVLFKKITRESFGCYVGLGLFWAIVAAVLDYVFIVKLFKSPDYYKLDVYIYYIFTLLIPPLVGWYKMKRIAPVQNKVNP